MLALEREDLRQKKEGLLLAQERRSTAVLWKDVDLEHPELRRSETRSDTVNTGAVAGVTQDARRGYVHVLDSEAVKRQCNILILYSSIREVLLQIQPVDGGTLFRLS